MKKRTQNAERRTEEQHPKILQKASDLRALGRLAPRRCLLGPVLQRSDRLVVYSAERLVDQVQHVRVLNVVRTLVVF